MKIDKVIMSCDDKRYYLDFWPLVSKVWKLRFNIHPVLILFGDKNALDVSEEYGTVVEFNINKKALIHIQTLWARYWYPKTEPDTTWIISDIDMFPISKKYFIDSIKDVDNNAFINLNADGDYFPSCYDGGKGKTFEEVLELHNTWDESLNYICERSKNLSNSHMPESLDLYQPNQELLHHWGIDERIASEKIKKYQDKSRIVTFKNTHRLDRCSWWLEEHKVLKEIYDDCHSLRPYNSKHKSEIDRLVQLLLK